MRRLLSIVFIVMIFNTMAIAQSSYENLSRTKIDTDQLPIRDVRKTAVWFNTGWNALTGFGAALSFYPVPKIALDGGIGLSSVGVKMSARGRYLFSVKNFSPFVGLGYLNGFGSNLDIEMKDTFNNDEPYKLKIDNSPYIQITGGFEYMAKKGFFTMFNIGYSILLTENYHITSGNPSLDTKRVLDATYGSGIVIEGGIGYAF